ncbi:arginyltransferase [Vibrio sp. SM6]|uniref:Aspartate/glutamate leucyltransferase n=1 Tax=Vibrio agarilyticus TaxID=2726741 RepID=A0A7X8TML5_9VIBR|nr:arginyltransferase [Vibrio agarilyticus]NLS11311.1 arginyltransferase [Vibrio agarilyticus]
MSDDIFSIRIGLTDNFPCSYLNDAQERVAVALDTHFYNDSGYETLMANGFRRSGDTIYKPQCDNCSACEALRIPINAFQISRSQKRLLKQAHDIHWVAKPQMDENWFDLYRRYINARHKDGAMYPANKKEFAQFSQNSWLTTQFIHLYQDDELIAVAVTDEMAESLSAFYTFFKPDHPLSLGTLAVLFQLEFAKTHNKQWLYLGYQVDNCPAMNYKVRFQRHQRLVNHRWQG